MRGRKKTRAGSRAERADKGLIEVDRLERLGHSTVGVAADALEIEDIKAQALTYDGKADGKNKKQCMR